MPQASAFILAATHSLTADSLITMPGHLKALIVILLMAAVVFAFARTPAAALMDPLDYKRRRNLWFALTLAAFLAYDFWLYAVAAGLLLFHASARESNKVALFFLALMVIPATGAQIPGMGLINYFFELNHVRLLELVILLPAFLRLRQQGDRLPFGRLATDKLLALFLLLVTLLALRHTTFTDMLRNGFYLFLDVFLPYFVISRSVKDVRGFRESLAGFVLAALVLALVCVFEALRHWHLYRGVMDVLGVPLDTLSQLVRNGILRAMGTAGHPIVAGYVMAVALAFLLFLKSAIPGKPSRRAGLALLAAGLAAPLSRGPWLGAAVMFVVFLATGPQAMRRLALLALAGAAALPLIAVLPGGHEVIDLLPFIGSVEKGSIDYRAQLIDSTYAVILRNPWFGAVDFALAPEMQAMIQGQGIIDVVNSYLLVSLQYGFIGLGLFVGFFALVAAGIHRGLRRLPDREGEAALLGRALLAALAAILVIIFTVSSISVIPVIFWSVAGLGVAYAQMVKAHAEAPESVGEPDWSMGATQVYRG